MTWLRMDTPLQRRAKRLQEAEARRKERERQELKSLRKEMRLRFEESKST